MHSQQFCRQYDTGGSSCGSKNLDRLENDLTETHEVQGQIRPGILHLGKIK